MKSSRQQVAESLGYGEEPEDESKFTIEQMIWKSQMKVFHRSQESHQVNFLNDVFPLTYLRIDVYGFLSNIPNTQRGQIQRAWMDRETKKPRSNFFKNPDYVRRLKALTEMFRSSFRSRSVFDDSKHNRIECVILCASSMSRLDSHNVPKATCDWLQREAKVITNDRYVDAFAKHKSNIPQLAGTEHETFTTIVLRTARAFDRTCLEALNTCP